MLGNEREPTEVGLNRSVSLCCSFPAMRSLTEREDYLNYSSSERLPLWVR